MNALSARVAAILELDPDAPALEFERRWYPWRALDRTATDVADAMEKLGLGPGAAVGVMLRNRPVPVGLMLGVLRAGGCLVTINPQLGRDRVRRDLDTLDLALLAAERADVVDLADLADADRSRRMAVLILDDLGGPAELVAPDQVHHAPPHADGVAVQMLTSGTTGPPHRVDLTYETLERVMEGAKHYESNARAELRLRDGVVVVNSPMVHLGGLFRVLQAVMDGRRFALLERFEVEAWIDCVRRHAPRTVSLVPAALRMVYDADLDPADLASVRSAVSGTAPLDPDLAEAFTERYGVPVLTSYAATEFGGGVAGWNLRDYEQYAREKRGSVGRAHAGCRLRVVDPDDGHPLPNGEVGLLEVEAEQIDPDRWIRTTDLSRLDDDGFLWIVGRADQTILRGGFKVQPEVVRAVLVQHPAVADAVVFGVDDARLGQVPVAVVERRPGETLDADALLAFARERLAPYEIPITVRFVDVLTRTASAKVDLAGVRAWFLAAEPADGR
ncbi:MAG: fatty acid--CoA ligase family protein [Acidimicrobiia bacterium]